MACYANHVNLIFSIFEKNIYKISQKNAANGQQSALSYVYDIRPKMVNTVKNSQKLLNTVKQLKTVNNSPKWRGKNFQ